MLDQLSELLSTSKPVSAKFLGQLLTTFGAYIVDDRGQFVQVSLSLFLSLPVSLSLSPSLSLSRSLAL